MKRIFLIALLPVFVLLIAACNGGQPTATAVPPTQTPPPQDVTAVPSPTSEGYPPPPPTPTVDESYPGANIIVPTAPSSYPAPESASSAYPAGQPVSGPIWIIRPVGEQCAEQTETPDLQTAVAELTAIGVEVQAQEMMEAIVCTACGCPTSAHFRVQIDAQDLSNAELLGWTME